MTVYRAYYADVYSAGPIMFVITYNLYGRKIIEKHFLKVEEKNAYLASLKKIEPRFAINDYDSHILNLQKGNHERR